MTEADTSPSRQENLAASPGIAAGHEFDLAIVGGGFSGLCTAWHLLTDVMLQPTFRCVIIEPDERLGAGLAYRTESPCHLLNVRARGMSITAADPGSFARWLARAAPQYSPDDFVPRRLYRRYLKDCFDRAVDQQPAGMMTVLRDAVRGLALLGDSPGYSLDLVSDVAVRARAVVLAIGNLPPGPTFDNGLLCSPWCRPFDFNRIGMLAIVGAGLTALDVILDAEAAGYRGQYKVISRHGLFPLPHREPFEPVPAEVRAWAADLAESRPTLRHALRAFQLKRKSGVHWELLVDSLRLFASRIWKNFDQADKRRFFRHLRTIWNIHLHRSCQHNIAVVARLKATGRLEQIHARVIAVEKRGSHCDTAVRLVLRRGTDFTLDADAAVDGTGLFTTIRRTGSALVAQLLDDGMVQPDDFCLGLKATETGQLLSADGSVRIDLFTVGTLRRGEELECTAVPEIRKQVAVMVQEILRLVGDARRDEPRQPVGPTAE